MTIFQIRDPRFLKPRFRFSVLIYSTLILAISCLGILWGISNAAFGAASDSLLDLESSLLRFETFKRETAIAALDSAAARSPRACDAHSQRALLLLELPLADAALRSGNTQDFDQHSRSLEAHTQRTLSCSPRDSFVWLLLFGLKNEHGLLDENTFDLLTMSYETSPNEAWVAVRRIVVAIPVILAAPDELRERVLTEFQALIRHGFVEMPALAYLNASARIRPLLQARVDELGAVEKAEFRRAVEKLKS